MGDLVTFKTGTKDALDSQEISNGSIYVTNDTDDLAIDLNGRRIYPMSIIISEKEPEKGSCKIWIEKVE